MRIWLLSAILVFFSLPEAEAFSLSMTRLHIDRIHTERVQINRLQIDRLNMHSDLMSSENPNDNSSNNTSSKISNTNTSALLTIELHAFKGHDIDAMLLYVNAFSGLRVLNPLSPSQPKTHHNSKEEPLILNVQYQYPIEQLVYLMEKVCMDLQIRCSLQSNENTVLVVFITSQRSESLPFGVW